MQIFLNLTFFLLFLLFSQGPPGRQSVSTHRNASESGNFLLFLGQASMLMLFSNECERVGGDAATERVV